MSGDGTPVDDGSASAEEMAEVLAAFPGAPVDRDNLGWYEGLRSGEVRPTRCHDCGTWHHPPGPRCPACWSTDVAAEAVAGVGVVDLVTVLHVGPAAPEVDYDRGHPLVSVVLDGVPGVRITAPVVDVAPDAIQPGLRVRSDVVERGGVATLVFRPTTEAVTR